MGSQETVRSSYGHLELRQAVGDLFFVWSDTEQAIRKQIKILETTASDTIIQGISGSIKHLKKLHYDVAQGRMKHILLMDEVVQFLSEALADRNLIAHGIRGWRGNIDHEAATLLLELDQKRKELSLASLRSTTERLSIISFQLGRLTYAAMQPDKAGIDNIYAEIGEGLRKR
jgi:hypothetical protein